DPGHGHEPHQRQEESGDSPRFVDRQPVAGENPDASRQSADGETPGREFVRELDHAAETLPILILIVILMDPAIPGLRLRLRLRTVKLRRADLLLVREALEIIANGSVVFLGII